MKHTDQSALLSILPVVVSFLKRVLVGAAIAQKQQSPQIAGG